MPFPPSRLVISRSEPPAALPSICSEVPPFGPFDLPETTAERRVIHASLLAIALSLGGVFVLGVLMSRIATGGHW